MGRDSWAVRAVAACVSKDEGVADVICLCCGVMSFRKAYVLSFEYR